MLCCPVVNTTLFTVERKCYLIKDSWEIITPPRNVLYVRVPGIIPLPTAMPTLRSLSYHNPLSMCWLTAQALAPDWPVPGTLEGKEQVLGWEPGLWNSSQATCKQCEKLCAPFSRFQWSLPNPLNSLLVIYKWDCVPKIKIRGRSDWLTHTSIPNCCWYILHFVDLFLWIKDGKMFFTFTLTNIT